MFFNLDGNNNGFPTQTTKGTTEQRPSTETQQTSPSSSPQSTGIGAQEQAANAMSFLTIIPQLGAKELVQFLSSLAAEFALVTSHADFTRHMAKSLGNAGVNVRVQYV